MQQQNVGKRCRRCSKWMSSLNSYQLCDSCQRKQIHVEKEFLSMGFYDCNCRWAEDLERWIQCDCGAIHWYGPLEKFKPYLTEQMNAFVDRCP